MLKKILLVILLIVVFSGSGIGTFYALRGWNPGRAVIAAQDHFDGHAFFVSSGQLNESNVRGNNDQLQIELHHIPAPAPGKSYYAWLLSDNKQNSPIAIRLGGALPVSHGDVHFLYTGTPQHENLIGIASRLLITEEKTNTMPVSPTTDKSQWSYYGELLQQVTHQGQQQSTALDSLH